ncbi:hypothetical protein LCGC14_1864450 [marine sediment metagenome]|uniref:Uncharacterized protein n=1 Tax=marine sediment metagenome TaxID=412755 RepID=A0A0F9G6L3_9ZZZZ
MDCSPEYIKMRLASIPDLGIGCKPRTPFHYITDDVHVDEKGDLYYSNAKDELYQLERQDQLQEMVGLWVNDRFKVGKILNKFQYFWRLNLSSDLTWNLFSMEQLWLAHVLAVKYQKTWNGEEWLT